MVPNFLQQIWENAAAERAAKAIKKREAANAAADQALGQRPAPPPPPPDPLKVLETELKAIDEAGDQDEALARERYLTLLARLAPPRTGKTPPPEAHALAVPPTGGPPTPAEVLSVLKEVGKTRDDLKSDLVTWTRLRTHADLAAELPALEEAEKNAREEHRACEAQFEEVEIKWAGMIETRRRLREEASQACSRANEAVRALESAQGTRFAEQELRDPLTYHGVPVTAEQQATIDSNRAALKAIREKARRLGGLEEVFFPPPPDHGS